MRRLLASWWIVFLVSLPAVLAPCFGDIICLRINRAFSTMDALRTALDHFQRRRHRYPTTEETLHVLVPDFVLRLSRDPWGNEYVYRSAAGGPYVLYSVGVDGRDERGTGDDVTTPDKEYAYETYGIDRSLDAQRVAAYVALSLMLASLLTGMVRGVVLARRTWLE